MVATAQLALPDSPRTEGPEAGSPRRSHAHTRSRPRTPVVRIAAKFLAVISLRSGARDQVQVMSESTDSELADEDLLWRLRNDPARPHRPGQRQAPRPGRVLQRLKGWGLRRFGFESEPGLGGSPSMRAGQY